MTDVGGINPFGADTCGRAKIQPESVAQILSGVVPEHVPGRLGRTAHGVKDDGGLAADRKIAECLAVRTRSSSVGCGAETPTGGHQREFRAAGGGLEPSTALLRLGGRPPLKSDDTLLLAPEGLDGNRVEEEFPEC